MNILLNRIFWAFLRIALSFRYRVKITGLEQLKRIEGPTLVIPNHPAYIDPPLVSSHIRLHKPLRPLVFSGTYRMAALKPLMALVNAFEVPDMSAQSRDAQSRALELIDSVVVRMKAGDCMLIYPSGRLQRGNQEVVGAARSVYEIVSQCPDINIVMVRTRGVWGSMFSCAEKGVPPDLTQRTWRALGWVLASCFFFLPRRPVSMEIKVTRPGELPTDSREAFNTALEDWYNSAGVQEPVFVRYHHWFGPSVGRYGKGAKTPEIDLDAIKAKTMHLVNELVQSHLGRHLSESELQPDTKLEEVGLDSLDRMDLSLKIEQQFGFRSNAVASTMGELWALADGQLGGDGQPATAPQAWFASRRSTAAPKVLADTVAEAFVRRVLESPDDVAVADVLSGVLSRRKVLVACQLMARRFESYPQKHVGIMLPATAAADVVFFALHLAGKVPVMMNWTTGPANLAHSVEVTGVKHIVTSAKMIDRLGIEVEGADYVFLEQVREGIGTTEKLLALLGTYVFPTRYLRKLPAQRPDEAAVFLFTSGSESLPKTVPLSHRNLIVNVGDGQVVLDSNHADSLLGFLPPFHSFGMTGNLLLPHLCGTKCIRFADPTDAGGLASTIAAYKPTMIFTTPTFLGYILSASSGDDLLSLRTVVTGAEKCPEAIFEQCRQKAPNATVLEGYGITECSPVVSANLLTHTKSGTVGKPVSHVDVRIVDVDTGQPVGQDETGMLLVAGPSIFDGYFAHDGPSPFVELQGRQWYKTGDLVSMDEDGFPAFSRASETFLEGRRRNDLTACFRRTVYEAFSRR